MPELPEVETIARDLRPLVSGRVIVTARTDWPRIVAHPDPEAFVRGLPGRRILGVERRAKWLLLDLDGGSVLAIQVMMTGQLFVVPADAPADRHVHVAIDLDDGHQLRLRDMRKFARVGLYRRDEAGRVVRDSGPVRDSGGVVRDSGPVRAGDATAAGDRDTDAPDRIPGIDRRHSRDPDDVFARHGPEPLAPEFTLARFRERLRARRGRLKPLLLDQSFVAGVGNIYADEALWRARLHPLRTAATLRPDDERRLYRSLLDVLAEAVERRGSSVDDYTAPEGDGEMQDHLQAYQRTGLPCLRCGRPMRRITVGQRGTHFCSWCQRLPAADRPGAASLLARQHDRGQSGSRRGPRWTELAGEGTLGLTVSEAALAVARARAERARRAAETRRRNARAGARG